MKHPILLDGHHHVVSARRASPLGCGIHEGTGATTICRGIGKMCYPISAVELRDLSSLPSQGTRTSDGRFTQRAPRFRKSAVHVHWRRLFRTTVHHPPQIYREKWGLLFTCMTTRAVHIEVAHSLDKDSCVMGIEHFIARRGRPSVIFSDKGTNFIGAEKELVAQFRQVKSKVVADRLARKGILWKFNPPAAPHHDGSSRRLVQSCKRLFHRILGTRRLNDEVLSTTLCLVEQFVNNRPMVPASSDPTDLNALTPNHFLIVGTYSSFPIEDQ